MPFFDRERLCTIRSHTEDLLSSGAERLIAKRSALENNSDTLVGVDDLKAIGARIQALRQQKGLSLSALARECEISKGYLSALENGDSGANPTIDALRRIAGGLGVTLAELLGGPTVRAKPREIPAEELPPALADLVTELSDQGTPLKPQTVYWLAQAQFRGKKPGTKDDYRLLLRILGKK